MREIEQKFELDDEAEVPSFAGIDGVARVGRPTEHELHATYFDTVDGRLAAAGIALRRRRGGEDEGWHLKESVGADERLETHAPVGSVGDDDVPEELAALVRARTRRRSVIPTATVENRRTVVHLLAADGTVLAEVADDRVVGTDLGRSRSSSWREVEVELVAGDRDLLAAVGSELRDAGASPSAWSSKLGRTLDTPAVQADDVGSTAGDVVVAYIAEQVEQLVRFDPLVRQDAPDAVHKMRVATRRLRSGLATFRRVLDRQRTDPLRDELKWLAGILGAARDAEVVHARLRELLDAQALGMARGPVRRRIGSTMRRRYRTAHRAVLRALDSDRYLQLLDALDDIPLRPDRADRPASEELRKAAHTSWKRWRAEVEALEDAPDHDTELHEVRKSAKRVRYAGEAVEGVFGKPAAKLAARMEALQEALGAHQDALIIQAVLIGLADDAAAAGEETFTYGRLHAAEDRRAEDAEAEGVELLDDLSAKPPRWLR